MEPLAEKSREEVKPITNIEEYEKSNTDENKSRSRNKKYFQNLKIWYTNADTLTASKIHELESRKQNEHPNIIIVTEAYPKNSSYDIADNFLHVNGYDLIRTDSGRGIVVYTAHHLLANKLDPKTNFDESLWCNIKINNDNNIIIGGIYRSPSSSKENNEQISKLLKEVTAVKHDHLIIAGDFNLKQIDWSTLSVNGSSDSLQYQIFDTVNDLFLSETIKQPTRFRGTDKPSNLDWVLTENPDCVIDTMVDSPLGPSDHSLICINYNCVIGKDPNNINENYSFYNGDYDAMRDELENNNEWISELENATTQEIWDKFHSKITGLIERHVPKKKFINSKKPPWYGRDIGNFSKLKKKAWNKYRKILHRIHGRNTPPKEINYHT